MEFSFDINNLLANEISVVDRNLTPQRLTYETAGERRNELRKVIDEMGRASAKAQGLNGPITSASRLSQSDCRLYIKKDAEANNGKGSVIGFLKVGNKKLFVYDGNGVQHELQPLCVLDFYVCELCQRRGSGKRLFDAMLQRENVSPVELAIDRPSSNCLSFLFRHFNLHSKIPQINNFVIFNGFFRSRSVVARSVSRQQTHNDRLEFEHQKQGSSFSSVPEAVIGRTQSRASGQHLSGSDPSETSFQSNRMKLNRRLDSSRELKMSQTENSGSSGVLPPSNRLSQRRAASSPNELLITSGLLSHHAMHGHHRGPKAIDDVGTMADSEQRTQNRAASPPLLQRGGPPPEYLKMTGKASCQGQQGHLNPSYPVASDFCDSKNSRSAQQRKELQQDTAFNIFGVTPQLPLRPINADHVPFRKTALR